MVGGPEAIEEAQTSAAIMRSEVNLCHDLIRPHERSVYMLVLSLIQNEADAEATAQEAFLKAFRNLSTFRTESRFSIWVTRIALNEAYSKLRQKKTIKTESLDVELEVDGHVSQAVPVPP
jgi:RNA polymerase sigma-70 factor (ECF subfamily)